MSFHRVFDVTQHFPKSGYHASDCFEESSMHVDSQSLEFYRLHSSESSVEFTLVKR